MNNYYDTIVIGSGCGGSAAAALMSHLGHKTLLMEKNLSHGGRASTYEKDGFKLDHGHIIMRSEKGPHGEVLRLIDRPHLIPRFSHCMSWPMKSIIDGVPLDWLPAGWKAVRRPAFYNQLRQYGVSIKEMIQIIRFAVAVRRMDKKGYEKINFTDMASFLLRYTANDYFHTYIGGLAIVAFGAFNHEVSAGEFVRVIQNSLKDKNAMGYPVNGEGVAAIPNSFIKAARELGCEIKTGAPVDSIIIDNGRVKGVRIKGDSIYADNVISSIGIKETVKYLVGKEHFESSYINKIENLQYSLGGLSLKYALRKKVTPVYWGGEIPGNLRQVGADMRKGRIPDRFPIMFVSPSNIDPRLAPEDMQSISFLSGGPAIEPGKVDWDEWVDSMKAQAEELFPGLNEKALYCEVSTPDDIAKFNGRCFGDAVGVSQTVEQVADKRPSPVSPINGLFYAGADVGKRACATELASESAIALYKHFKKGKWPR